MKTKEQPKLKSLPKHVAHKVRNLSIEGLAKFRDPVSGKRLHSAVIASELRRRIDRHHNESVEVVKHKQQRASRTLGAPVKQVATKVAQAPKRAASPRFTGKAKRSVKVRAHTRRLSK